MLLLPVNSLQGKTRFDLFKQGLELLCFDGRVCFHTGNLSEFQQGTAFGSAFFCKDILPEKIVFRSLNPYQKPLVK